MNLLRTEAGSRARAAGNAVIFLVCALALGCKSEQVPDYGIPDNVVTGGPSAGPAIDENCAPVDPAGCELVAFADVDAVFNASCGAGCHDAASAGAGLVLVGPEARESMLEAEVGGRSYLVPCDTESSQMLCNIAHGTANATCGSPMPKGGGTISDDEYTTLSEWIRCGAKP